MSNTFGTGKKAAIFLNVVVMVALAIVAAGFVIYLTGFTSLKRRIDLTSSETYTLTSQTISMLGGLEKDVEIITVSDSAVYDPTDVEMVRPRAMEYVRDLLQEYKVRANGRLLIDHLDARQDSSKVRALLQELGISGFNFAVVRCGANRRVLALEPDLAEIRAGIVNVRPTELVAYRVEEAISSAIFAVIDEKRPKIYVITGHDEVALAQTGPAGGAFLANSLGRDNIEMIDWPLFQSRRIPDDADAVFLLGPQLPYVDEERAALDSYLARGGRMLICFDPFCHPSLDSLWMNLGIKLERNFILLPQTTVVQGSDPSAHYVGPDAPGKYGTHPIVANLQARARQMIVQQSGALAPSDASTTWFTSLLVSSVAAFGDVPSVLPDPSKPQAEQRPQVGDGRLDKRTETQGQRILAGAIEPKSGPYASAKVVFVASWTWLTNDTLRRSAGNDDFLRNCATWLIGRQKGAISPPPRLPPTTLSDLKPDEFDTIARYTVIFLPGAAALLALLIYLARRS